MRKLIAMSLLAIALTWSGAAAHAAQVPQDKMTVTVDLEAPPDYAKGLSIDGDTDSFWHTQWNDIEKPE